MRKGERRVSRTGPWNPHPCAENAQGWGTPGTRSLNPSLARVLPSFARLPRRGRLGLRALWFGLREFGLRGRRAIDVRDWLTHLHAPSHDCCRRRGFVRAACVRQRELHHDEDQYGHRDQGADCKRRFEQLRSLAAPDGGDH